MNRKAAAAALAAAGVAIGAWIATGIMPPPGQGELAYVAHARGPCEAAKALAADPADVDCVAGEQVYVTVELHADPAADGGEDGLPPGMEALQGSLREASAEHPGRALTVRGNQGSDRCLGGEVRRVTSLDPPRFWTPARGWGVCCGAGCECAGPSCAAVCPPHVFAGDTCDAIICRRWPDLEGCT